MCAKYDELSKFDDDVLDKADAAYEKEHGDYDENERRDEYKARADFDKVAKKIQREKDGR